MVKQHLPMRLRLCSASCCFSCCRCSAWHWPVFWHGWRRFWPHGWGIKPCLLWCFLWCFWACISQSIFVLTAICRWFWPTVKQSARISKQFFILFIRWDLLQKVRRKPLSFLPLWFWRCPEWYTQCYPAALFELPRQNIPPQKQSIVKKPCE